MIAQYITHDADTWFLVVVDRAVSVVKIQTLEVLQSIQRLDIKEIPWATHDEMIERYKLLDVEVVYR